MSLHLIVTGDNYPTPDAPNFGTFLSALVDAWCDQGVRVDVIAPVARVSRKPFRFRLSPPDPLEAPDTRRTVHPLYTSLSNSRFGPISARDLGIQSFSRAVARAARSISPRPQLVYGHFLYRGGASALEIAEDFDVPAVVALGEATFDDYERDLGIERIRRDLQRFSGIVAVADWIRDRCIERYGVDPNRVRVFPNGVDLSRFHPIDRDEARRRLEIPLDDPLICFVGHLIERKGPLRVLEAASELSNVRVAFVGDGPQRPTGSRVVHAAPANHAEVPLWIAASDVFALPTLAEGSCNAVIEAMACGRAIVTSDIPSIREMLGSDTARLVDPSSVSEIATAFSDLLSDDRAREALARRALLRAQEFSLTARANGIREWLEEIVSS